MNDFYRALVHSSVADADEAQRGQRVCTAHDQQVSTVNHDGMRCGQRETAFRVSTDWSVGVDQCCSRIFTVQHAEFDFF